MVSHVKIHLCLTATKQLGEEPVVVTSAPVHFDPHPAVALRLDDILAGELPCLVGVRTPRRAGLAQRITQRLDAEPESERGGWPPHENRARRTCAMMDR